MNDKKLGPHDMDEIIGQVEKLQQKYAGLGQDFLAYMEGLLHSNGLNYWNYVHLDSLLGLQTPRTNFKDEVIFIVYHQITELYFKLIKQEIELLTETKENEEESEYRKLENWYKRISRCNNYLKHLASSFDIMVNGMDMEEFRKFRMALLPASGFQSVQFRHIEIMSTRLSHLIHPDWKGDLDDPFEQLYEHVYWKGGGIDLQTKSKTITLQQFEEKYDVSLKLLLKKYRNRNLAYRYEWLPKEMQKDEKLIALMRDYDTHFNIFWRMGHLAAASRYLVMSEKDAIQATGGTNWRKYLPPKFQKIIFFKTVWNGEEKTDWGKAGVTRIFREVIGEHWMKATS